MFHQFIEAYPPTEVMCGKSLSEEAAPHTGYYRLELQVAETVLGTGTPFQEISPCHGYLHDCDAFIERVQGDIRCSLLVLPVCTLQDHDTTTIRSGAHIIKVVKSGEHFTIDFTDSHGMTRSDAFELPEGVTYATNIGEHQTREYWTNPDLPFFLSVFQSAFRKKHKLQQESFLLVKYSAIEPIGVK